jgi:NADPH2:quinone reductase
MKAVQFHQTGTPDVLVYEDVPTPSPKPGEVLIKIESIGVNYADTIRRRGDDYPEPSPVPFTLGVELAGTVEALGEGIDSIAVGTSVFATPGAGAYAEYIALPVASVIPLPPGIDLDQAAGLVAHGLSAIIVLQKMANIQPGETVLIEGAAGGLGQFSVQLAKLYGATVIAAASTAEKRDIATSLGADYTVDYTLPDWPEQVKAFTDGKGVDVVLETTGGAVLNQALDAMATFGRMIFIGQSSGETAFIDPWRLTTRNHTVSGFYVANYLSVPGVVMTLLTELIGLVLSGKITLQVGAKLPLSKAADAHRMLEGRQNIGKIILKPWA